MNREKGYAERNIKSIQHKRVKKMRVRMAFWNSVKRVWSMESLLRLMYLCVWFLVFVFYLILLDTNGIIP